MIKIIPFAVPVFMLLILAELGVAWLQGRRDYHRFSDAITALSCGIGSQVVKIFFFGATLLAYTAVYEWVAPLHGLTPWSGFGVFAWIFAILAYDHQYYWWHRHSHRVNVLWAAHVVHHQSEDYNLAIALRQALFTNLTVIPYYLPLALIGVDPVVFAIVSISNTLYQFWIHTRTVGKLGPLEWVFNTPSHHRVHHGINPAYIDKNHAGMLIIWDRLYGTFVEEQEEPVYGTVTPLGSYDPIWANFHNWADLARFAWTTPRWADKLRVWFMPPEWTPDGPKHIPEVDQRTFRKWDVPVARGLGTYIAVHYVIVVVATVWILWMDGEIGLAWMSLLALTILWATWSFAQLLHRRELGPMGEVARLLALTPTAAVLMWGSHMIWPVTLVAGLISVSSLATVLAFRAAWTDRSELDIHTQLSTLPPTGPRGVRRPAGVTLGAPAK